MGHWDKYFAELAAKKKAEEEAKAQEELIVPTTENIKVSGSRLL